MKKKDLKEAAGLTSHAMRISQLKQLARYVKHSDAKRMILWSLWRSNYDIYQNRSSTQHAFCEQVFTGL